MIFQGVSKGKGYPDLKTLELLHSIREGCPSLPFLILVDADPYGMDILLTYAYGPSVCILSCYHLRLVYFLQSRINKDAFSIGPVNWIGVYPSELLISSSKSLSSAESRTHETENTDIRSSISSLQIMKLTPKDLSKLDVVKRKLRSQPCPQFWLFVHVYSFILSYCFSFLFRKEAEFMEQHQHKAEIEALSSISLNYLTKTYIPSKIQKHSCVGEHQKTA